MALLSKFLSNGVSAKPGLYWDVNGLGKFELNSTQYLSSLTIYIHSELEVRILTDPPSFSYQIQDYKKFNQYQDVR